MDRNVKGVLFLDYVRMIRKSKGVDWKKHLTEADVNLIENWIEPSHWYPFDTFQRMGEAILAEIAAGDMDLVRSWGRLSVSSLISIHEFLVKKGSPGESLKRFQLLKSSFFDFDGFSVEMISDTSATLKVYIATREKSLEPSSYQLVGMVEGLIEVAGARDVQSRFLSKSWEGADKTLVDYAWQ